MSALRKLREQIAIARQGGNFVVLTPDEAKAVEDEASASHAGAQPAALTFARFREANVRRCLKWHPAGLSSWSPSDWLTAALGELGELASEVKTFNRARDGLPGNKVEYTPEQRLKRMANEAADVVTYLDLFCAERGIDLARAIVEKFNEVSERVGFPDRIELTPVTRPQEANDGL